MTIRTLLIAASFMVVANVNADSSTLDAAIGGGIGGAAGAAVGNEVGGREGAIIGGAAGAAVGAAVATDGDKDKHYHRVPKDYDYVPKKSGTFCPPGQAKKGRC